MELGRSSKEANELKRECVNKFLSTYPRGFADRNYLSWERDNRWNAHERWQSVLSQKEFKKLLTDRDYDLAATRALGVANRTDFLDFNEKMGLRDAIKDRDGAEIFSKGIYQLIYGTSDFGPRFTKWCESFAELPGIKSLSFAPRNKNQVMSWPVLTIFGFLARPEQLAFLKPEIFLNAAHNYGHHIGLESRPSWNGYAHYLHFCEEVRADLRSLRPRDLIDIQSFIWVIGSEAHH